MTWILILMMHVGPMGSGNSNALTSVGGFKTESACVSAGKKSVAMAKGTVKDIEFVCARSE